LWSQFFQGTCRDKNENGNSVGRSVPRPKGDQGSARGFNLRNHLPHSDYIFLIRFQAIELAPFQGASLWMIGSQV